MNRMILPGMPIAVLALDDGGHPIAEAVVVRCDSATSIRVRLDGERAAGPAIAVIGEAPGQWYVRAVLVVEGGESRLDLLEEWRQPYDKRARPRYPTNVQALVLGPDELEGHDATIIDISDDGIAVQVSSWSGARDFVLGVERQGARCAFRCHVVSIERRWPGIVLHCRLLGLTEARKEFVDGLIAVARSSFEAAQQYLAFRSNDPEHYQTKAG
ncbi:MAG: PilZ domain-containing protein [Chloroflexi bacterium]|nr:PilZ domain-containing protein [Chloroflexota bacterium]